MSITYPSHSRLPNEPRRPGVSLWIVVLCIGFTPSGQTADTSPKGAAPDFVASRLQGRVAEVGGAPVSGATIQINRRSGAKTDGQPNKATSDTNGDYEINIRFVKGQTLSIHEVFVDAPGYVRAANPAPIRLLGGETIELPFVLAKGEVFAGSVRLPLTDMERLSRQKPESISRVLEVAGPSIDHLPLNARSHVTEPGGNFAFWLPAGEYTVRVHGYRVKPVEWSGLKSGRRDLVLDLAPFAWSTNSVGIVFDQMWETMDQRYSYFFLKTNVNWNNLKKHYRPRAVQATNWPQLASVLADMLSPLRDLHVRIETPAGIVPTYRIPWTYNGNFEFTLAQLEDAVQCGGFATVGRSKMDKFGCLIIKRQTEANPTNVAQAVAAMEKLRSAPGFIVDLRRANGGSEPLAMELAKFFCAQQTIYAKSKYRKGPKHDDFSPEQPRFLPAVSDPYTKPVVCLFGSGTVSSGEGFAKMMKCLPHVTTVGLPTRGASGNPKPWPLPETQVTVHFSRWVDLMPDGTTFEDRGIPPEVIVDEPRENYTTSDPTWNKAVEVLREKIAGVSKN